jgi:hypothetical protein
MKFQSIIKSLLFTFILTALTGSAFSQNTYVLDDFRGTYWGAPVDSFYRNGEKMELVKTGEIGVPNTFTIEGDDLTIGSVKLNGIYYVFSTDDKFDRLVFKGSTAKAFKEMKYILITKFGQPELKDINHTIQYSWVVDGVRIYLQFDPDTDFFTVDFYSNFELNESRKKNRNVGDF